MLTAQGSWSVPSSMSQASSQTEDAFAVKKFKHTHTHARMHARTHTHTHTHTHNNLTKTKPSETTLWNHIDFYYGQILLDFLLLLLKLNAYIA